MSKINIVLASDNNFAQHLGVTIVSVLENSPQPNKLSFHVIENGINKEKILSLQNKYNTNIELYNVNQDKLKYYPSIGNLSKAAYLRLFIPEILPNHIKKVIYLDCDLVCLKDISELYNQNLNNLSIAAKRAKNEKKILKNFFYPNLNSYFNSGVMLIDINKWREKKIIKKSLEFTKKYKNNLKLADQDILNCLFKNNWQTLNKKFNFRATTKNPIPTNVVILHYLTHLKPWSYLYPYKNKKYYLKYLKLSPWSDFKYPDKTCKNILVKHINKIKYILKPFTPLIILEARRKRLKN